MLNIFKFRLCLNEFCLVLSELAVIYLKKIIHFVLAAGKMGFPDQKLHPSGAKYRRILALGAQRLEMLLV
jgi:hypothetical protein